MDEKIDYVELVRKPYFKERTRERSEKFIKMRAQGLSLTEISKELGVCRQTLAKWDKDFEVAIGEIKYVELEAIKNQCKMEVTARIKNLGTHLEKVRKELEKRDLSDLSTEKLSQMYLTYFDKFKDEIGNLDFESKEKQFVLEWIVDNPKDMMPRFYWDLRE